MSRKDEVLELLEQVAWRDSYFEGGADWCPREEVPTAVEQWFAEFHRLSDDEFSYSLSSSGNLSRYRRRS